MDDEQHVGALIRQIRGEQGLTQEALASQVGLSPATLGNIETGHTRRPRVGTLVRIAKALGIDPRELTAGKALAR